MSLITIIHFFRKRNKMQKHHMIVKTSKLGWHIKIITYHLKHPKSSFNKKNENLHKNVWTRPKSNVNSQMRKQHMSHYKHSIENPNGLNLGEGKKNVEVTGLVYILLLVNYNALFFLCNNFIFLSFSYKSISNSATQH